MDPLTLLFVVGGLVLLASEFVAPSLVAVFLGVAALLTAGVRALGLVDGVAASFLLWGLSSLALVLPFRPLVQRLVPGRSVVKRDATDVDRDRDEMGQVVEVVDDITEDNDEGRIRFQGTTWRARATAGSFKKGERVQLVFRRESVWFVEPVASDDALAAARRELDHVVAAPDGQENTAEAQAVESLLEASRRR
jgi:membrane protein implicated in regulation of membrane protease activity